MPDERLNEGVRIVGLGNVVEMGRRPTRAPREVTAPRDDEQLEPCTTEAPHHSEPRDTSAEHDAGTVDDPAGSAHDLRVVDPPPACRDR
jgi:hypothetical protein